MSVDRRVGVCRNLRCRLASVIIDSGRTPSDVRGVAHRPRRRPGERDRRTLRASYLGKLLPLWASSSPISLRRAPILTDPVSAWNKAKRPSGRLDSNQRPPAPKGHSGVVGGHRRAGQAARTSRSGVPYGALMRPHMRVGASLVRPGIPANARRSFFRAASVSGACQRFGVLPRLRLCQVGVEVVLIQVLEFVGAGHRDSNAAGRSSVRPTRLRRSAPRGFESRQHRCGRRVAPWRVRSSARSPARS
jgi:hypothetical protein